MFVAFWLIFLVSGLAMAVATIVWGIRGRQFEDQDRARYLPLVDLAPDDWAEEPATGARTLAWLVTGLLLATGALALGATLWTMTRTL